MTIINAVTGLSVALLLQTSVSPVQEILGPVERLTLVTALVIAVRVLDSRGERKAREYTEAMNKKDDQILAMTTKVVETLVLTHAVMERLDNNRERNK